jgi:hypothetical protein
VIAPAVELALILSIAALLVSGLTLRWVSRSRRYREEEITLEVARQVGVWLAETKRMGRRSGAGEARRDTRAGQQ